MVPPGVTTFSELEFNPLGSLPDLFIAGGLGDFDFGEIGGVVSEALVLILGLVLVEEEVCNGVLVEEEVCNGRGGGGGDVDNFLRELRRSRLGNRLQVG